MKRSSFVALAVCTLWCPFSESDAAVKPAIVKTVIVREGTNIAATVSPDEKTIVFDLQGVLWSLPMSGGAARQLTDPYLEACRPSYSPAGDLIAFQAYKGGTFHIWAMRPDGSDLHQLTDGHGDDREPSVSPDGRRIAFASDRAFKGSYDIWVVEISSGKLTQWTSTPADEYEPAWSKSGDEIAYVSGVGSAGTKIVSSRGSGPVRTLATAQPGAHFDSPSMSPSDNGLTYVEFAGGKSTIVLNGIKVSGIKDAFPFPAVWLKDGRLLFTADGKIETVQSSEDTPKPITFSAEFKIHRGAYQRKVQDLEPASSTFIKGIVSPVISPDGAHVVFEALNQLWITGLNGKATALTHDTYYKEDPAWSPDGRAIAYSSDQAGSEDIYLYDVSSKTERRLTKADDSAEVSAAWSPDGKKIAFQNQAGATFVLDIQTGEQKQVIGPEFAPSKPSWGPNGRSISISALKPYTKRFREGTSQILTVNLDSGSLVYSEPAPFASLSTRGEDGPVYSPDGKWMAFVMNSTLWVKSVDAAGLPAGNARQITREVTDAPTWQGDSAHLLYLSNGILRLVSLSGSLVSSIPVSLSFKSAPASEALLIHASRLWNGLGEAEQSDVDIFVSDKRIRYVRPHSESAHAAATAEGARFIDATNLTVLPGLWESHTHQFISGKFYGDRLSRLWLAFGVTELQSQGDPVYRAIETRESLESGARVGPRYFATGEAIDGERVYYNFMRPTTSLSQLHLELERAKAMGYDNLKTYVRLTHEWQRIVSDFGHKEMGVTTASHYMLPGLANGVDGMTHISATSRFGFAYTRSLNGISYSDMRSLFAASGEYVISTPFASFPLYAEDPNFISDTRLRVLNTPWDQQTLKVKLALGRGEHPALPEGMHMLSGSIDTTLESLRTEEDTVAALVRSGVMVLAGTDSPLDNVATALHLNLRAQVKYGLMPWEALQTATLFPARSFGVDKDLGSIQPGKLADLVITEGNPLSDIKDLAKIKMVIRGGHVYTIADLLAPFARDKPGEAGVTH